MTGKHQSSDPLLDELIDKYGSDKNMSEYNLAYANMFKDRRFEIKRVLEIGVGSFVSDNSNFKGILDRQPHYTPGGSLRAWRDYFPNAIIHGVDIGEDCKIEEERIETFIFDSTDMHACKKHLYDYKYDLIVDDGDHAALSQLLTFKNLAPLLTDIGHYCIEDLGGYQGYPEPDGTWYKPELLKEFKEELENTASKFNLNQHEYNVRPLTFYK